MEPVTRITGSLADYCVLVMLSRKKIPRCRGKLLHYGGLFSVILMFCKRNGVEYGYLVDFFAISLPTMHAYVHAHPCSLFKTGRKSTF